MLVCARSALLLDLRMLEQSYFFVWNCILDSIQAPGWSRARRPEGGGPRAEPMGDPWGGDDEYDGLLPPTERGS